MRIGERLIHEEIITVEQLDEALRAQVLRGGRIGTNLIELEYIDIETLAACLGRHHGMPVVLRQHSEIAAAEIQARMSAELAARWGAVPMGRVLGSEERIAVAVMDPLPEEAVAEISEALGSEIIQAVAPELRVLYQLERAYGLPRSNRFLRVEALPQLGRPDEDDALCDIQIHIHGEELGGGEPTHLEVEVSALSDRTGPMQKPSALIALTDPGAPAEAPAPPVADTDSGLAADVESAPESPAAVADEGDGATAADGDGGAIAEPVEDGPRAASSSLARIAIKRVKPKALPRGPAQESDTPTNLEQTLRAIRQATGRDRAGDLVVTALRDYFGGVFEAAVLLVIREHIAIGWKGFVRDRAAEVAEAVAIPLNTPSSVFYVFYKQKLYVGPPPEEGADVDRRLWTLLKCQPPLTVAVAPIVLDEQTVCLIYAHSSKSPDEVVPLIRDDLEALVSSTTKAITRLIRAAQR